MNNKKHTPHLLVALLSTTAIIATSSLVVFTQTGCATARPSVSAQIPQNITGNEDEVFYCSLHWSLYYDSDVESPIIDTGGHDSYFKSDPSTGAIYSIHREKNSLTIRFTLTQNVPDGDDFDVDTDFLVRGANVSEESKTHIHPTNTVIDVDVSCTKSTHPYHVALSDRDCDAFSAINDGYNKINADYLSDDIFYTGAEWISSFKKMKYLFWSIDIPDDWHFDWKGKYDTISNTFRSLTVTLSINVSIPEVLSWNINVTYSLHNYQIIGAFAAPQDHYSIKKDIGGDPITGNFLQLVPTDVPTGAPHWHDDKDPSTYWTDERHYEYHTVFTKTGGVTNPPWNGDYFGWYQKDCYLGDQLYRDERGDDPLDHVTTFNNMGLWIRSWRLSKITDIEPVKLDLGENSAHLYNRLTPDGAANHDDAVRYNFSAGCLTDDCFEPSWSNYSPYTPQIQDPIFTDASFTSINVPDHSPLKYYQVIRGLGSQYSVPNGIYDSGHDTDDSTNYVYPYKHIKCYKNNIIEAFEVPLSYCFTTNYQIPNSDNVFSYPIGNLTYINNPA